MTDVRIFISGSVLPLDFASVVVPALWIFATEITVCVHNNAPSLPEHA